MTAHLIVIFRVLFLSVFLFFVGLGEYHHHRANAKFYLFIAIVLPLRNPKFSKNPIFITQPVPCRRPSVRSDVVSHYANVSRTVSVSSSYNNFFRRRPILLLARDKRVRDEAQRKEEVRRRGVVWQSA